MLALTERYVTTRTELMVNPSATAINPKFYTTSSYHLAHLADQLKHTSPLA